ncbi:MAG: sigma-70 family RNA polymerase sigma factor [bacterium]|nr:sigma-70 family RNA polymerase sigma factor [bacterium]
MPIEEHLDDTASLLIQLRNGDSSAQNRILQRHADRLKQMVGLRMDKRLKSRFDPSDVVQETILIASQRLDQFPFDFESRTAKIPFYVWLRKIAWEQLIKFQEKHLGAAKRSVSREVNQQHESPDDSVYVLVEKLSAQQDTPSQEVLKAERQAHLLRALQQLKPSDRSILELRYVEHLAPAEIAAILQLSQEAVRTRHFRAIRRLNSLLAK